MIQGLVAGSIPDYQISAWAMAILCRGMTTAETAALTDCMLASGTRLQAATDRRRVDKHSTGGLGDKVSLILAPLLACFDVDVPMLSGRGLGITGGTLDKLESYAGYRCDLSTGEIEQQLRSIGCVITGTTPDIAPADRRLYSLRDVTGTVPSIPLITSSIMCKKLAESLDALVLDVKFGSGAFMRTLPEAATLAGSLCETGQRMGLETRALLTDMNQPLGRMVGNAGEANESVQVLQGRGPADVRQLTLHLAAELLVAAHGLESNEQARESLSQALDDGRALRRFQQLIESQGGQFSETLPLAPRSVLEATSSGWVCSIDGQKIGRAIVELGGGRRRLGDAIDHCVGLEMLVGLGDAIEAGQPLVHVYGRDRSGLAAALQTVRAAIEVSRQPVVPPPLIHTVGAVENE